MDAEIREGITETLESGALPGCVRACGVFCFLLVVFFLVVSLLACMVVLVACCAMHFAGWFLTWWLLGCSHHRHLSMWLLLFQMLSLVEACFASLLRGCLQEITEAVDSRVRPGFARTCGVCYALVSSLLKVVWCVHILKIVAHAPKATGCAESLPAFMHWYSCVLLLQLAVVEPLIRLGMSVVLWAATNGFLTTSRGAKTGTLEAMEVIEYNPEMFAATDDPSDSRPQKECCFCLDEYDADMVIIRTPCQHIMHRDCLARWLQTSHFCPICRADVEEAPAP